MWHFFDTFVLITPIFGRASSSSLVPTRAYVLLNTFCCWGAVADWLTASGSTVFSSLDLVQHKDKRRNDPKIVWVGSYANIHGVSAKERCAVGASYDRKTVQPFQLLMTRTVKLLGFRPSTPQVLYQWFPPSASFPPKRSFSPKKARSARQKCRLAWWVVGGGSKKPRH